MTNLKDVGIGYGGGPVEDDEGWSLTFQQKPPHMGATFQKGGEKVPLTCYEPKDKFTLISIIQSMFDNTADGPSKVALQRWLLKLIKDK